MPRPALQLHLPQPCAESWAAMTPAAGGRHCAACQKVVVDFTHKTDAELLAYFRQAAGAGVVACGHFRVSQLNRPLRAAAPAGRWRAWLAAGLALGSVLGAGRAVAQAPSDYASPLPSAATLAALPALPDAPPPASQRAAAPASPAPAEPAVLRGVVLDDETCQALPGVSIFIKGTTTGTSTNADGQFELAVGQAGPFTLVAGSVGYSSVEHLVTDPGRPLELALLAEAKGGIGFGVVPPVPWHPRALYHWGKYWLTRPFHF